MVSNLKQSHSLNNIDEIIKKPSLFQNPFDFEKAKQNKLRINSKSNIDLLDYKKQTLFDSNFKWCPLCLNQVIIKDVHFLWFCGCCFCLQCLKSYFTINIIEKHQIDSLSCPNSNCINNNPITSQEIKMLVDESIYILYQKYKLDLEVNKDPSRTWCPTANCDNICLLQKPTLTSSSSLNNNLASTSVYPENTRTYFYCDKCDKSFCSHCRKAWHPKQDCQSRKDNKNFSPFSISSSFLFKNNNIKKCPKCSVCIERNKGCAQMTCRQCKHVFCWFCLQSLEEDFLLRHYDYGQCKNKLGHSRASVIWHRAQVVGIFAGFGMLLLLASPLFLLAAPCIICCNCCCYNCDYINENEINEDNSENLFPSKNSLIDQDFLFHQKK